MDGGFDKQQHPGGFGLPPPDAGAYMQGDAGAYAGGDYQGGFSAGGDVGVDKTGMMMDPNTGMMVDPNTGMMMDPNTGMMMAPGMQPGAMPGQPQRKTPGEIADELEKLKIKRLKANTYKQRRLEGRPNHGKTSMICIGCGTVALMLQSLCVFSPMMRYNRIGVLGYGHMRSWGFFQVSGQKYLMWHDIAALTCGYWGALNVGGICASPICLWYRLKCESYVTFMIMSYLVGFVMIFTFILHIGSVFWTFKLTTRMIRWAGICWPIITVLNIVGMVVWTIIAEELFEELNSKSFYPVPALGPGLFAGAIACVLLLVCSWCGCQLWKWWPEIDLSNFDSGSDENSSDGGSGDSDSSDDKKKKGTKPKKGK